MKTITLFISLSLACLSTLQAQKKGQDGTPTKSEMDAMMKEAQKEMDNLDPETKRMMDSLGVKVPSFNNTLPDATDKEFAAAAAEDGKIIPSRKTMLITKLPKKIFTNAELAMFVKTTNVSIGTMITPKSKGLAEKIIVQFKTDPYAGAMMASTANGLWIVGLKEPAVYLMGKALEILPNANNYNNYAAYLTMSGAAQAAIPVLEKLNQVHRKNSTVLNNLGQAWLQLGEADKAIKYLDSAIRVYAQHPQANFTKCLILESQGKTAEAVVALKRSLKHSITKSKMDKLRQLEKKEIDVQRFYAPRTYFSTSFNLAIYSAVLPKRYAMSAGGEAQAEWDVAREQLQDQLNGLDVAIRKAKQQADEELNAMQRKATPHRVVGFSPHYYRALSLPTPLDEQYARKFEREAREDAEYLMKITMLKQEFTQALEKEQERYEMKTPNGSNMAPNCSGELPIINKYVGAINEQNQLYRERRLRGWASDAYMKYDYGTRVAPTGGVAATLALELKRDFVRRLLELRHESHDMPQCVDKLEPKKFVKKKLPDYDQVNCKTSSTLYVPLTGQIVVRCNQMDVFFNPLYIPVKASWTEDFNADRIVEASISITVKAVDITAAGKRDDNGNFETGKISVGKNINGIDITLNGEFDPNGFTKGSVELGISGTLSLIPKNLADAPPIDISLKNELGVSMEIGPEGITDFIVKESSQLDVSSSIEADFAKSGEETTGLINELAKDSGIELKAPSVGSGASLSADNQLSMNAGYSGHTSSSFSKLSVQK